MIPKNNNTNKKEKRRAIWGMISVPIFLVPARLAEEIFLFHVQKSGHTYR
jgi:hypothetical protein